MHLCGLTSLIAARFGSMRTMVQVCSVEPQLLHNVLDINDASVFGRLAVDGMVATEVPGTSGITVCELGGVKLTHLAVDLTGTLRWGQETAASVQPVIKHPEL